MTKRTPSIAITLAVALTSSLLLSTAASAQGGCSWYAKTSIKQARENVARKCGFSGPDWSVSLKDHLAYCSSNAPDVWKTKAKERDQQLSSCKK